MTILTDEERDAILIALLKHTAGIAHEGDETLAALVARVSPGKPAFMTWRSPLKRQPPADFHGSWLDGLR